MRSRMVSIAITVGLLSLALVWAVSAGTTGSPEPPGPPNSTTSYTLEDIYNRLDTGAAGSASAFTEPASGPGTATGHTLDEVMAKAPVADQTNGAVPAEVLTGRTFWGLRTDGTWGPQTGTAAAGDNVSGPDGFKTFPIPDGLYSGSKQATANDSDLVAGNIKSGVNILGVTGTYPPAPVRRSGQDLCYDTAGSTCVCGEIGCPSGQDGDLDKGIVWPNPRFTSNVDNNGDGDCYDVGAGETCDGTVTDNLTGLIWLRKANCLGSMSWEEALAVASSLYDGWTGDGSGGDCELADGSKAGDWRLPNVQELQSLVGYGFHHPVVPNTAGTDHCLIDGDPFRGVQSSEHWSSTAYVGGSADAWYIHMGYGYANYEDKGFEYIAWTVRGGP